MFTKSYRSKRWSDRFQLKKVYRVWFTYCCGCGNITAFNTFYSGYVKKLDQDQCSKVYVCSHCAQNALSAIRHMNHIDRRVVRSSSAFDMNEILI